MQTGGGSQAPLLCVAKVVVARWFSRDLGFLCCDKLYCSAAERRRSKMKDSPQGLIFYIVLIALIAFSAGCGGGSGSMPAPTPTPPGPGNAFVYTANAGGNNISAFANDSTGALTQVAGSPFNSPGQPFGIAATPNNKFLYVSSFQNAVVSGFAINPNTGALTPLNCATQADTGVQPLKIAISPGGAFLYTANQGGSVSAFSIDATTGCLTAISTAATDAVARGLTVERTGKFLYVVTGGGGINVFSIAANGAPSRLASGGFDSGTTTMTAVRASPNSDVLIAADAGNADNFRVFTINTTTGALTFTALVGTGTTPSAIAFNRNPTFADVYAANTGSNDITHTAVTPQGEVFPFLNSFPDPGSTGPVDLDTDPSGKFLYVAGNGSSNITVFSFQSTQSTLIANVPTGSGPESIVVLPKP
jgi:6-phosphogluconolactonase (cycloisomerase 2 family)